MSMAPVRIAAGETVSRSRTVYVRRVAGLATPIVEIAMVSDEFLHHAPKLISSAADVSQPVEYSPSPPVVAIERARYTREEWQEVKRGIDQAFDEHERLWPRSETGKAP
jgi:hypothetical protein